MHGEPLDVVRYRSVTSKFFGYRPTRSTTLLMRGALCVKLGALVVHAHFRQGLVRAWLGNK